MSSVDLDSHKFRDHDMNILMMMETWPEGGCVRILLNRARPAGCTLYSLYSYDLHDDGIAILVKSTLAKCMSCNSFICFCGKKVLFLLL